MKTAHVIPLVLSTKCVIPNKLQEYSKLLNLRPALYILGQKAVIFNTYHIVHFWQKIE